MVWWALDDDVLALSTIHIAMTRAFRACYTMYTTQYKRIQMVTFPDTEWDIQYNDLYTTVTLRLSLNTDDVALANLGRFSSEATCITKKWAVSYHNCQDNNVYGKYNTMCCKVHVHNIHSF